MSSHVVVDHVIYDYHFQKLKIVAAVVETAQGTKHRIGYLQREGWFCNCAKSRHCAQIKHVKKHVPAEGVIK